MFAAAAACPLFTIPSHCLLGSCKDLRVQLAFCSVFREPSLLGELLRASGALVLVITVSWHDQKDDEQEYKEESSLHLILKIC